MKLTAQQVIDALESSRYSVRSYSGRCMYGKDCVGIDLEDMGELLELAAELAGAGIAPEGLADLGRTMRWDQMGKGYIVYWPTLGLTEDERVVLLAREEEEEGQEDE